MATNNTKFHSNYSFAKESILDMFDYLDQNNGTVSSNTTEEEFNSFDLPWYIKAIYILFYSAMVSVSVGGNVIVIWIVLAHKRMRTVTNYFLVNLAITDASISIFSTLFSFSFQIGHNWYFGENYCKFTHFISNCTIAASVFTFVAIAIDRYFAIIHPLKPRMPARVVLGVIAGIWLVSIVIALPNLIFGATFTYQELNNSTVCYMDWPDGPGHMSPSDFAYNIFLMVVQYFVPLGILAVAYCRIGIELWGSTVIGDLDTERQQENIRSKRKVVKMMMVVVIMFTVCWLPYHAYFLVTNQHTEVTKYAHIQDVYLCIFWLAMSSAMYNPIIYCWMNARFRKGFKYVFRWCPGIKWDPRDSLSHSSREERRKTFSYCSIMRTSSTSGARKFSITRNNTFSETVVYGDNDGCAMTLLNKKNNNSSQSMSTDAL